MDGGVLFLLLEKIILAGARFLDVGILNLMVESILDKGICAGVGGHCVGLFITIGFLQ